MLIPSVNRRVPFSKVSIGRNTGPGLSEFAHKEVLVVNITSIVFGSLGSMMAAPLPDHIDLTLKGTLKQEKQKRHPKQEVYF